MRTIKSRFTILFLLFVFYGNTLVKDKEWVTISGKVIKAMPDYFLLQKDGRRTIVEIDDRDWFKEGQSIFKGDFVVVHGQVDHDPYEIKKIEADSVFVRERKVYIMANSEDEEIEPLYVEYFQNFTDLPWGMELKFTGRVESISGKKFILKTAKRRIKIDTSLLDSNPLSSNSLLTIKQGNRVIVHGIIDKNPIQADELNAVRIYTLLEN